MNGATPLSLARSGRSSLARVARQGRSARSMGDCSCSGGPIAGLTDIVTGWPVFVAGALAGILIGVAAGVILSHAAPHVLRAAELGA